MKKYLIGPHIEAYSYEDTKLSIYNKNTRKTFVLGEKEANVFKLMNGVNSISDIQSQCSYYSETDIENLASAFSKIGLFDKERQKFNLFKIKLRLFSPNRILMENSAITRLLHYGICIGAPLIFFLSFVAMGVTHADLSEYIRSRIDVSATLRIEDMILIAICSLFCLALHEFGHMVTARRYGVNVPEIGIMLYFLIPCAYTNITGINLLKSKEKRLMVLLSGTFVNIGLIGVCNLVMAMRISMTADLYCMAVIIVNIGMIVMNTMVLIKFDGYYILETILDEPKLRERAIGHLRNFLRMWFSHNDDAKSAFREATRNAGDILQHITYCVYAVLSVFYVPFIILHTVIPIIF